MGDVAEAMDERGVSEDATPDEKMKAVFGFQLGDESWWDLCKEWMKEAEVKL